MKRVKWAVLLSLFVFLLMFSNTSFAAGKDGLDEAKWRNGQMIFELYCAVCHGYEGVPFNPRAPSFADGERMGKSDEDLLSAIVNGLGEVEKDQEGDPMPAWGEITTAQEREDVLYYIKKIISKGKVKEE